MTILLALNLGSDTTCNTPSTYTSQKGQGCCLVQRAKCLYNEVKGKVIAKVKLNSKFNITLKIYT
jgi:hypothetical protein